MNARAHQWEWVLGGLAVLGALLWLIQWAPARITRGIAQERQNYATPPLGPTYRVSQTFIMPKGGLSAIEVLAARYSPEGSLPQGASILFMLERLDRPASAVALRLPLEHVYRGQRLRFTVAPLKDSAGGVFRFTLSMAEDCGIGLWASAEEALAGGAMYVNGAAVEGDLAFFTYHQWMPVDLIRDLAGKLPSWGRAWAVAALALGIPGLALVVWLPWRTSWGLGEVVALILVSGLSFWPLVLLWSTAVGLRLGPGGAWGIWAVLSLAAVVGLYRRRREMRGLACEWPEKTLGILIILSILLRFIQARDLIVPAWVDSVHHTMVTQIIVEQGIVPQTGEPYIRVPGFHYHFGFHANAAVLSWLGGVPPYRSVLWLGQILAGLAGVPLYALTVALLKHGRQNTLQARWAGVVAAAVPSFMTYMPAYYTSWGRYTQLAGLLLLPVLIAETFAWVEGEFSGKGWAWPLWLASGLALIHYRALAFYGTFWVAYCLYRFICEKWRPFSLKPRLLPIGQGLALAAAVLLVIAPWVVQVVKGAILPFGAVYGTVAAPGGIGDFPVNFLKVGRTPYLLAVAGIGWLWGAVRRYGRVILLGAWIGGCLLLANPRWVGLKDTWIVSGGSVAISYWLPAGVLVGVAVGDLLSLGGRFASRHAWGWLTCLSEAVLSGGLVAGAVVSLWYQADIINANTILVRESDLPAIAWVKEHLPKDSLILINTQPWMEGIPMGSDAGWWLPYLTGHRVTHPPVLYTHGEPAYRDPITKLAEAVEKASSFDDPALIRLLEERGVTYIFVGSRGGPLEPSKLYPPHYIELYRNGPTRVYRFVARPEGS